MSAPVTKQFLIADNADDVRRIGATWADDLLLGFGSATGTPRATALRLTNVQIKRGARIKQANIRFRASGSSSLTVCNVIIKGDKQANSPQIPSTADWDARTDTAASVAWNAVLPFVGDVWYETPDFAAVIQEIVNQPGWVPGNALTIYLEDNGSSVLASRNARARNFAPESAPVITIEWEDAPNVTTVHLRSSCPPHQELLQIDAADLSYGEMLMRQQTASFRMRREDPSLAAFGHLLHPDGAPPMFSIERYDGTHPWVGFLRTYDARYSDSEVQFKLADHVWRLQRSVTKSGGTARGPAGLVTRVTLAEIERRAAPALYLDLSSVGNGPGLDYEYQAQNGDTFLNQMAEVSGWEWGFRYDVSSKGVNTALLFQSQIGRDRRGELVIEEGIDLQDVSYSIDYDESVSTGLVVGGTGTFGARPSATATTTPTGPGLGGTRIMIERQVTEQEALFNAAARMLDTPEHVAESISFSLLDGAASRVNLGDIITCRLSETDPAGAIERVVRILGVNFDTDKLVHRVEAQVVR